MALTAEEKSRDIDTLEVLAIAKALVNAPRKCNVIVRSDSNVALYSFMKATSTNPEIRQIIYDTVDHCVRNKITFVVQKVTTKENRADYPSRNRIDSEQLTGWVFFWQDAPQPLFWSTYMNWVQQIHEREPFKSSARTLLVMLQSKNLRVHAIGELASKILKEHQLFEGEAAKVLATAVLQYLRFHPLD